MNKQEFLSKAIKHELTRIKIDLDKYSDKQISISKIVNKQLSEITNICFYSEWVSGRKMGQSSWGQEKHFVPDIEPEIDSLDAFLEEICPNIPYLKYKRLYKEILKRGDYTRYEFYNNSETISYKYILLSDLWEFLSNNNLVS